jgi:hypothetical protein
VAQISFALFNLIFNCIFKQYIYNVYSNGSFVQKGLNDQPSDMYCRAVCLYSVVCSLMAYVYSILHACMLMSFVHRAQRTYMYRVQVNSKHVYGERE